MCKNFEFLTTLLSFWEFYLSHFPNVPRVSFIVVTVLLLNFLSELLWSDFVLKEDALLCIIIWHSDGCGSPSRSWGLEKLCFSPTLSTALENFESNFFMYSFSTENIYCDSNSCTLPIYAHAIMIYCCKVQNVIWMELRILCINELISLMPSFFTNLLILFFFSERRLWPCIGSKC